MSPHGGSARRPIAANSHTKEKTHEAKGRSQDPDGVLTEGPEADTPMHRTVTQTPIVSALLRWISLAYIRMVGWTAEGRAPEAKKCVIIAAPHTSNWDFVNLVALSSILRANIYWMGKDTLFRRPFGSLMKWLGGIAIDRSRASNVTAQSVKAFTDNEELLLIVPAEGTRQKVQYWKRGFYYIAHEAGVPIMLGYLDYGRRAGGFGRPFVPTGDLEADMAVIREFYTPITAKFPENTAPPALPPQGR